MTYSFLRKFSSQRISGKIFIVFIFLLCACTNRNQPSCFSGCLNEEEKKDLKQFFDSLLFQNYGAYVLFGTKPICDFSVRNLDSPARDDTFQKFWANLSLEEREKIEAIRREAQLRQNMAEAVKLEKRCHAGWLAFQKLRERFRMNGFLFRVLPMGCPDAYDVFFINVQQTALILAENYDLFRQAAGMDFDPQYVVFEAEDPNSLFWNNVMSMENHLAKGLLFGFGQQNAILGDRIFSAKDEHCISPASTDFVPQGSFAFNVPFFRTIPGDKTAEKYGKERSMIANKYRNQDLVEVTLRRLFHSPTR